MGTETVSSRYRGIETWDDRDVMEALLEAQLSGVAAVKAALPALAGAAAAAAARLRAGKRLAYAGAGTSARLAVQ
ncbi:MAG: N-acetylmuramic acid 6-phosphate etherase, partial [Alphaproteobacteria bacterium]